MIYSYYGSKLKLNSNKINRSKRARETEARASFYLRFLGGFFELWPALATSRRAEDADWDEAQTREEEEDEEEEEEDEDEDEDEELEELEDEDEEEEEEEEKLDWNAGRFWPRSCASAMVWIFLISTSSWYVGWFENTPRFLQKS